VVGNAKASLVLIKEFGSLLKYFKSMLRDVDCRDPRITQTYERMDITCIFGSRPLSPASTLISKDLLKRNFKFVGPRIIQAFLQASGLYQAHDAGCFKHRK
jgi:DNA-3-methyladenine glycosylase I